MKRSLFAAPYTLWMILFTVLPVILIAYYAWNEFLYAIIFIDSDKFRTIPAGLMNLRDALQTDWGVLLAGMTISATPLVTLFLLMQKQFIRGMTAGSVKG